jgi:FKBP-type peptidyl-prolyl cis-trans isomerase (trigger factor)
MRIVRKKTMKPFKNEFETKVALKNKFVLVIDKLLRKNKITVDGDKIKLNRKAEEMEVIEKQQAKKRKLSNNNGNFDDKPLVDMKIIDNVASKTENENENTDTTTTPTTILLFYAYCIPQMSRGKIIIKKSIVM